MPQEKTFRKWAAESSKGFVFTLKVPMDITHKHRLKDVDELWQFFFERASTCLGDKLGPFLFQLPPSIVRDDDRLAYLASIIKPGGSSHFFIHHRKKIPRLLLLFHIHHLFAGTQVAIEFRHKSWFCDEVVTILRKHNMALVENYTPDSSLPSKPWVTATWSYIRLHGAKVFNDTGRLCISIVSCLQDSIHEVDFSPAFLEPLAARAVERRLRGIDQFIFFLNDVGGAAPKNARSLSTRVTELVGGDVALVPGWRAERDVVKGGPGSIESMFKKAAKPAQAVVEEGDQQAKRAKVEPPAAAATASPRKGTMQAFFALKPQ